MSYYDFLYFLFEDLSERAEDCVYHNLDRSIGLYVRAELVQYKARRAALYNA